jgi:hypothetical protein
MSLDGGTMLSILFIILALGIAAFCFPAGHATAANFLPIPIIAAGVYFGIDLIYIGILVLIGAWIFVKAYWIDR